MEITGSEPVGFVSETKTDLPRSSSSSGLGTLISLPAVILQRRRLAITSQSAVSRAQFRSRLNKTTHRRLRRVARHAPKPPAALSVPFFRPLRAISGRVLVSSSAAASTDPVRSTRRGTLRLADGSAYREAAWGVSLQRVLLPVSPGGS